LSLENTLALWLMQKVSPFVKQGNMQAIETIMRIHKVPEDDQIWLLDKILAFYAHTRKEQ